MTGVLRGLLEVKPTSGSGESWLGAGNGPAGKRAFGGQFAAQALAAAGSTVSADSGPDDMAPTSLHVQFLRAGDAALPVEYDVDRVFDGRTSKSRRVLARQDDRLLVTATVGFACSTTGPEHGKRDPSPGDPNDLPRTGPAGPAPSLPLDEIDIRIDDRATNGGFVRRLWWRATVSLPPDPFVHSCVAVFVSDVYLLDAALRVHGRSMGDRRYRSGTTDASMWFHRPIRADQWNLLESTSPAAARGRAVVTASLIGVDGAIAATLVHEGLVSER